MGYHIANRRIQNTRFAELVPVPSIIRTVEGLPVGVINAYMGTTAPDSWLLCDGSQYDPAELPELAEVNADFHAPDSAGGVFRVPDLRGRSPVGAHNVPNDPVLGVETSIGERQGDWRTKGHQHVIAPNGYANSPTTGGGYNIGTINQWAAYSGEPMTTQGTDASGNTLPHGVRQTNVTEAGGTGPGDSILHMTAYSYSAYTNEGLAAHGAAHQDPQTVVNFIVYAGRPTAGITPIGSMPAMTTRHMIEARLAKAGVTEEEVKMLRDQLESIKTMEAA